MHPIRGQIGIFHVLLGTITVNSSITKLKLMHNTFQILFNMIIFFAHFWQLSEHDYLQARCHLQHAAETLNTLVDIDSNPHYFLILIDEN